MKFDFTFPMSASQKRAPSDELSENRTEENTATSSSDSLYTLLEDDIPSNEEVTPQKLNVWTARTLLLLVAVIWGTNFAAVKYLSSLCFHPPCNHTPSEAALARFGVASIVAFPLLFRQRWGVILAGMECGLYIAIGYLTQAVALSTITAGKCAFICSLTVVFVPLLSALLFGKPLKSTHLIAAAIALTGVALLEGMVNLNSLFGGENATPEDINALADPYFKHQALLVATSSASSVEDSDSSGLLAQWAASIGIQVGDIIALGQPIGFGFAFMRIEHYVEKFRDVDNRILTLSAAQCVMVGFISLLWVLYDFNGSLPDLSYMIEPHRIVAILWTGIVTTVFAIFLEGIALQGATATDAALIFASEPVWASMFGFWLLNERLGLNSYVGGAIILIASLIGSLADILSPSQESQDDDEQDNQQPDQQEDQTEENRPKGTDIV